MKKIILIVLALIAIGSISSCGKTKRCICFEVRSDKIQDTCRGLEVLGSDASCTDKDGERVVDSGKASIVKNCIPEE